MLLRYACLLCLCACLLLGAADASHAFRKSFHCYRPFDSLSSFSLSAMKAKDNCWLDYMRVQDAGVMVNCYNDGHVYATATSGDEAEHGKFNDRFGDWKDPTVTPDRSGCYATMFVKMEREGGTNNRGYATSDEARYAVKLHTKGGGEVHYKGMDGLGYSACCMLLNQPQSSSCAWRNVTHEGDAAADDQSGEHHQTHMEQYVEYCLLEEQPEDLQQEGDDPLGIMGDKEKNAKEKTKKTAIIGSVTKPLHRQLAGIWTMEVLFFRGHASVGKVVSDFNVTHEMAGFDNRESHEDQSLEWSKHGASRNHHNKGKGDVQSEASVSAVVPVKSDEKTGSEDTRKKVGGGHHHHRDRKHHNKGAHHQHHNHRGKHEAEPVATAEEDLMVE